MKKAFLALISLFSLSCSNEKTFTTKEIIQDFSKLPKDSIIAKYGEPQNSKWKVNGISITKMKFENMNNTSFDEVEIVPQLLDEETGFQGTVNDAGNIYTIKLGGKSEVVYNSKRKGLRVSLEE